MKDIDFSLFSALLNWFEAHGGIALWAVGIALCLLIVLLPFLFKLKGRREVQKGVRKLKKDLMVWDNLSTLAKGGEKADEEREKLTVNTRLIYELFNSGLKDLKKAHYAADHPWYVLVGEPRGGKSSLLLSEDLELMSAAGSAGVQTTDSDPVRFFSGNLGAVLDVSGRIFFDRWMGGSSAEWLTILKLIRKHHKKLPLSGVVLAIPADALLADDRALTRRKAHLIAMELDQLTRSLSMVMPCHVVITKMDEVTGFRSYFNELEESLRRKIFGWQPPESAPYYEPEAFNRFWSATLARLREGVKPLMVSRTVIGSLAASANRMDGAGDVFLFPENFNALKANLDIYLEEIFSRSAQNYRELLLEGVFFTSAQEGGVSFNRQFADLLGKPMDDAPMPALFTAHSKAFFIRDLFVKWILGSPSRARFTKREIFRRHLPAYGLMLALLAASALWINAVYWDTPALKYRMQHLEAQIAGVTKLFAAEDVARGSLISPQGRTTFTLPMPGQPETSRLNFFLEELSRLYATERVPLGYYASGYLLFGSHLDIGRNTRRFLFNEIQSDMAFLPTVTAMGQNLLNTRNEPFTVDKRNAVSEYLTIAFYREKLGWSRHQTNELYDPSTMRALLNYLVPTLSKDMIQVLGTFDPENDKSADLLNTEVVNSVLYRKASAVGAEEWIEAWQSIVIYPNTDYVRMRSAITHARALSEEYAWLVKASNNPAVTPGQWNDTVAKTKELVGRLKEADLELLEKLFRFVSSENKEKDAKKATSAANAKNALLGSALAAYETRLSEDFEILKHFSEHRSKEGVTSPDNSLLTPEGLEKSEKEIREKLRLQLEGLEKDLASLRLSPLFKIKEAGSGAGGIFAAELRFLRELLDTATGPSGLPNPTKPSEIESVWVKEADFFDTKRAVITSFVKKHASYEVAKELGDSMELMVGREELARLLEVAQAGVALFPHESSKEGLVSALRREAARLTEDRPDALEEAKFKGISEVLGPVKLRPVYSSAVLAELVTPVAFLEKNLQPLAKNKFAEAVKEFLRSERWQTLLASEGEFTREFIRYWAAFADNLKPQTTNWKSFRDFAEKSRAYEVNTDLLSLYDLAHDMVSKTSRNILDEETVKERDAALADIGQRRKMLNLQYTESCVQTLAAWASLPMSALEAYRTVQSMPASDMRATLLLATGKNAIPWWNAFVEEGTRYLKLGARSGAASQLTALSGDLNRFPLTSVQSDRLAPIATNEMRVLASKLGHDSAKESDEVDAKSAVQDAATPALQQKIALSTPSLKGKLALIDKLALSDKPVYWTMVLPDATQQQQLSKRYGARSPNAVARYRYLSVTTDAGRSPLQSSAGGKQPVVIADGDLERGEAELDFYQFSDSAKPSATVRLSGLWAMLRAYLARGAIADKDKKTWWIPLTVKDSLDETSVFFVGLRFSEDLPKPADWPR